MAPFGEPFFLEVRGEVRDFALPRTNPYLRRFFDWMARRGELTTQVHYRVVGGQIAGTNEVFVQRLAVEPARSGQAGEPLGLPLGLMVALLKNPRGDIRLSVPVSGELGSPQFSFGEAIATAFRNVLLRLVTGPLEAIGRVFRTDEGEVAVAVDPLPFEPGSAALAPDAARQLQRVADVLRASPYVGLQIEPVVTEADRAALRLQEVTARVHRLQRERGLDFAAAAATLFRSRFPDRPLPGTVDTMLAALGDSISPPEPAARALAARRLEVTRQALREQAGIEPGRLMAGAEAAREASGEPRVEFTLRP